MSASSTPRSDQSQRQPSLANPYEGVRMNKIPRMVQFTSPVSTAQTTQASATATALPLNLILVIIGYLDDVADIARVTRTSRLLYYMTLPQLYQTVGLHSYPEIRYVNGRPEGFGSGSPFTMALNGLVTKSHAQLVQHFRVWGEWKDIGVEDFSKGRVPDNSMMLNILMRAATDKMNRLQSFSWELDCKPLKTLYQGLATHDTLTSLTLRFPSSRIPRPAVVIPPMANLRAFKATDIDPLCYPDDISMLLRHSYKLEDLRLHFSPRMRQDAEPSLSLDTYFGQCMRSNYLIPLKHIAMQNYFGTSQGLGQVFDAQTCKSIAFLEMFGGSRGGSKNVYLDDTWKDMPADKKTYWRSVRCNEMAPHHVAMLNHAAPMDRIIFVNERPRKTGETPVSPSAPVTPDSNSTPPDQATVELKDMYIDALTRHHGSSLKQVLLSDQWALDQDDISNLIRSCPNLEQLGIAVGTGNDTTLRLLLPFLQKLHSIRILNNISEVSPEDEVGLMERKLFTSGASQMKWIGIGDWIFKCGENYELEMEDGSKEMRRKVTLGSLEDVQHVDIWKLDSLDISVDPVAPFGP